MMKTAGWIITAAFLVSCLLIPGWIDADEPEGMALPEEIRFLEMDVDQLVASNNLPIQPFLRPRPALPQVPRALVPPSPHVGNPTLAPGVYKTEPFSCIVVVPGPHPDEEMVWNPGGTTTVPMPTVGPPVRFIPWQPK